jgi:uracil-DNA glycosylase
MVAHGGAGLLRARIRGRSVLRWPALSLSVRTGPDGGSDPWVLPESWRAPMSDYCSSPAYEALRGFVEAERTRAHVLPAPHETFAALERCDFDAVRVVILGQDPYPTPGHAHGLAFSVRPGVRPPGSLRNIFKELQQDVGASVSPHGYLDAWAQQGVLLLNAVLTVRASEAASHTDVG